MSTYAFPWWFSAPGDLYTKLERLVNTAAELQVPRIQVCDNAPLDQLSEAEHQALLNLLEAAGVAVEVGTRGLIPSKVLRYLQLAAKYNSGFLRLVIDDQGYEPSPEKIKDLLSELTPHFEQAGVKLALENHDRFRAGQYVDFIESTNPEIVAICLDTVNSLGAGEGINEVLNYLAPYCINLHIKDVTIRRLDSQMGFNVRGCPAGKGNLNIPEIIKGANKGHPLESITLELWPDDLPADTDPLALEMQWAKESIKYLKEIINTLS